MLAHLLRIPLALKDPGLALALEASRNNPSALSTVRARLYLRFGADPDFKREDLFPRQAPLEISVSSGNLSVTRVLVNSSSYSTWLGAVKSACEAEAGAQMMSILASRDGLDANENLCEVDQTERHEGRE